jgi:hypothetical protein
MRNRTVGDEMEESAAEAEARSSCWSAGLWMFGLVDDDDGCTTCKDEEQSEDGRSGKDHGRQHVCVCHNVNENGYEGPVNTKS